MNIAKKTSKLRISSLADVAKGAGVSIATASLALRNSPRVREETKQKILLQAKKLDYLPDPAVRKLMVHLRNRRGAGFRGTICGLAEDSTSDSYVVRVVTAAKARAQQFGYNFIVEHIPRTSAARAAHEQSLEYRGIEGLVFLPSRRPLMENNLYNWDKFALAACGFSPNIPDLDRVASNWLDATRVSLEMLRNRGYTRIGILLGACLDALLRRHMSAAVAEALVAPNPRVLRPLFYLYPDGAGESRFSGCCNELIGGIIMGDRPFETGISLSDGVCEWYKREKPDVLLIDCEEVAESLVPELELRLATHLDVAVVSRSPSSLFAGVCPAAETVGEKVVDLLDTKILHGVTGLPAEPLELLYRGKWMEGNSLSRCNLV